MFVITGANGNTGRAVAETLLQQGKPVRVILHSDKKSADWKARGAEVAVADLADSAALAAALKGASAAYIMCPPLYGTSTFLADMAKVADSIAAGIKTSGIDYVVLLSSIGAQQPAGTGPIRNLHYAEKIIPAAAPNVTFLRAPYFMENYAPVLGAAVGQGVLPSFFPINFRLSMAATLDIGRIAADLLLHPTPGIRVVEMEGPAQYTPADIAATLTTLLGKPVNVVEVPLDAVVPEFTKLGFTEDTAKLFREMYEGILNGTVAFDGTGERRKGTVTPREVLGNLLQAAASK
jgi:uncharacterized protein YbjT (DUF2867 family)